MPRDKFFAKNEKTQGKFKKLMLMTTQHNFGISRLQYLIGIRLSMYCANT